MKVISTHLTDFDYKLTFNLATGKIAVEMDCIFIGIGNTLVSGAKVAIVNETTGFPIKSFEDGFDIAPPMTGVFEVDFPKAGGIFQYGNYTVSVMLNDGTKTFTLQKQQYISGPESDNGSNMGTIKTEFKADCNTGKVLVYQQSAPGYKGKSPMAHAFDYTLYYPGRAQLDPVPVEYLPFDIPLHTGENEIVGNTDASYDIGDNIFVVIRYNGSRTKNIRCQFNLCEAFRGLETTLQRMDTCSAAQAEEYRQKMATSLQLIIIIMLGQQAGEDVSHYIEQLEEMTGCSCDCTDEIATGIPASSVVIRGCTVQKTTQGLTTIYDIGAKSYNISLSGGNKAYFSITSSSTDACEQVFQFSIDVSALISEIHNIYAANATLKNQLLALVWGVLSEIDPKCLTTTATWSTLDAKSRVQLLVNKICEALGNTSGGGGTAGAPDVSLTCVSASFSSSFVSGSPSGGLLNIPCSIVGTGVISGTVTGAGFSGTLQTTSVTGATTMLSFAITYDGSGTAGSRNLTVNIGSASEPVSCVVTATISAITNCSAPVAIAVVSNVSGNQITFSPAAFAPPSYQVQRRLLSSQDVAGSYTTIGTPTYNSSTGKYEIVDPIGSPSSPVANTEYYYKAISLCSSGARPFVGIGYANMTCPAMTITPGVNEITYEFPHLGGDIDVYQVSLWNAAGTVRLAGPRTMSPPFGAIITDTFADLSPSTNYILRVEPVIAPSFSRTCSFNVQTNATTGYSGTILFINNSVDNAVFSPNEGFSPDGVTVIPTNQQSFTIVTPSNDPGHFRIWKNAIGTLFGVDEYDISELVVAGGVASIMSGRISVVPDVPGTTVVLSGKIIVNGIV